MEAGSSTTVPQTAPKELLYQDANYSEFEINLFCLLYGSPTMNIGFVLQWIEVCFKFSSSY